MANLNVNKTMQGGRLTADVEVKQTTSGISVCSFTIAVNRRGAKDGNPQTDFFNCIAWRNTAEFIGKYFKKGSSIFVVGTLQNRSWTDNDGNKRYATEIIVDEAYFVDSKSDSVTSGNFNADGTNEAKPNTYIPEAYIPTEPNFEVVGEGEDLPF